MSEKNVTRDQTGKMPVSDSRRINIVVAAFLVATAFVVRCYAWPEIFWDGKLNDLDDKGGIGVLINLIILIALILFQWPAFG